MQDKILNKLIDKCWLKYESLPLVLLLNIFICIPFIPKSNQESTLQLKCCIIIEILAVIIYVIFTIKENLLPCAKKGSLAVLFIIDSETDKAFEDVKFKLARKFQEQLTEQSKAKFEVKCVERNKLKNYNVQDKLAMIKLLQKTNCIFHVDLVYTIDDICNAENYEMDINAGVIHPNYQKIVQENLLHDLTILNQSIEKIKFNKDDKIDKLNITALNLTYICKYIIGTVFLFANDIEIAREQYSEIYSRLKQEHNNVEIINWLKYVIPRKYFACNMLLSEKYYMAYLSNKDKTLLDKMEDSLNIANTLFPDTYGYNLNMALVYVLKYRNIKGASQCITKAKSNANNNNWRYSTAFLSAYTSANPLTVYKKYQTALKYPYNVVNIAQFIEDVLVEEPDKFLLHLALGLVYEDAQNTVLMKHHFAEFVKQAEDKQGYEQILQIVNDKMSRYDCNQIECDHNCYSCSCNI